MMKAFTVFTKGVATSLALMYSLTATAGISEKDAMGKVTATIGDKAYEGIALSAKGERSASATFHSIGGVVTILSIQTFDPDADRMMNNVLTLEIPVTGPGASAQFYGASVSFWPEGMSKPFYISDEENKEAVTFKLDTIELGANAKAKGSFQTKICRKDGMFKAADPSDCMTVKGRFDTSLEQKHY